MGESQQWILSRMGEPTKLSIFLHETARMMLESPSSHYFTAWFHSVLAAVGVPKPYPTADQIALCTLAAMTGLVLYFLAFGPLHLIDCHWITANSLATALREQLEHLRAIRPGVVAERGCRVHGAGCT